MVRCAGYALPMERRIEIAEVKAPELTGLGASVECRSRHDDPEDPAHFVVMHDPEGNEFCVGCPVRLRRPPSF